jgi:monovalent cation/hydrogen antiporter
MTLKPLLRALGLHDDDPVGREVSAARERALRAGLASFAHDQSPVTQAARQKFTAQLAANTGTGDTKRFVLSEHDRLALQSARQSIIAMRANDEIGDDAFHRIEEEFDRLEMAGGSKDP